MTQSRFISIMKGWNFKMWKCPNCETLNQGNVCTNCGEEKTAVYPVNDYFEPETADATPDYMPNDANKTKASLKPVFIIAAAVVLCIILFLAAIGGSFMLHSYNSSTEPETADEKVEEQTEYKNNYKTNKNTKKQKELKHKKGSNTTAGREAVSDVEGRVQDIRDLYYKTQNNLDSLSTVQTGDRITQYHNDKSELVRIDVLPDEKSNYTRYYYFDDNKLYFAFIFDGEKEHRFYFHDDMLFRWIDETGTIYDNDFNNGEFMRCEEKILKEVKDINSK